MTLRRRGRRYIAATDPEIWYDFNPGQRVLTREGFFGVVTAVEDGFVAGNEQYIVELEGGMGGGEYASSELTDAVDDGFDEDAYLASVVRRTAGGVQWIPSEGGWEAEVDGYSIMVWGQPTDSTGTTLEWGVTLVTGTYANPYDRELPYTFATAGEAKAYALQTIEAEIQAELDMERKVFGNMDEGYGQPPPPADNPFDDMMDSGLEDIPSDDDLVTYASEHYPELSEILVERPPPTISTFAQRKARYPKEGIRTWRYRVKFSDGSGEYMELEFPYEKQAYDFAHEWWESDDNLIKITVEDGAGYSDTLVLDRRPRHPNYVAPLARRVATPYEDLEEAQDDDGLTHAGLVIKALDTGRLLLVQRTLYYDDDEVVRGMWEFPGGSIDDDESAVEGAVREFQEETGLTLPEGWELGGAYNENDYLGVIVNVPSEAWTNNAWLLTNETMGIGWFSDEEAEMIFRGDVDVPFDTIKEAGSKTADMGWFTDKVLFPMAEAFDSGLPEQYRYDQSIGTFPADVAGVVGEFSPDNPYIGARVECRECGRNTRHINAICIGHQEGYDNLLLAIQWETVNNARTAARSTQDDFTYREPRDFVFSQAQKWSIVSGTLKDGSPYKFFIDENTAPSGVIRLDVTYLEGSGPTGIDYTTWTQEFDRDATEQKVDRRLGMRVVNARQMEAAWADVQAKAKRIKDAGHVRVISASPAFLVGEVRGDTNIYQSSIQYEPGTQRIATWECGCAWAAYSWARSGPWKKYEGRMCSHVQALQWEGQSRGMFNKEVEEDQTKPKWMSDPTIQVQRPGDYKTPAIQDWRTDASRKKVAWGSPSLSSLDVDQLRALLQMAQAEGQNEVERWVRDEMRSRGVYSSKAPRQALVFQSKMDARDWLEKGIALLLAGGILLGAGGQLPTVDPMSGGGNRPAVTQQYEVQQQKMIDEAQGLFRAAGLQFPNTNIVFNNSCKAHVNGTYGGENLVTVCNGDLGTLVHELAHAWEAQYMTDSARQKVAEKMGHDSWDTPGLSWADKPWERTAEVIKWKVMGGGSNGVYQDYLSIIVSAELKDDPEPALPTTTADEDTTEEVDPRLAWILEDDDMDISKAAQSYLRKEARAFSVAEQQELINEGEGELARNFSSLDIRGTHYEYLEDEEADDEYLW